MTTPISTLSDRANLVLECLHQHRLLRTGQLHTLTAPGRAPRGTQSRLVLLTEQGLIASVAERGGRRGRERVWHLTTTGAGVMRSAPTPGEPRRKQITPEMAAGPLQRHTLAVNDACIAFVAAARERGDECGPLSWRHEVAHRISPNRTDLVIADAVLRHQAMDPGAGVVMDYRFIELDRATMAVDQLAEKLGRYTTLANYTPAGARRPGWQEHYLAMPGVLVVLTDSTPARLQLRIAHVISLCRASPNPNPGPKVLLCHLDELIARGPYAPIFTRLDQPNTPCDWLGAGAPS